MVNDRDALPSAEEWAAIKRDPASVGTSPGVATVPATVLHDLIDAMRVGLPNEACGILVSDKYWGAGGTALRWVGLRNAADSPYRYMIDAQEQLTVWMELDDADEVVWAIVHSHVASPARPSQTDIGLANYPDSLYVVCSLIDFDHPDVTAWSIVDGVLSEVPLVVLN